MAQDEEGQRRLARDKARRGIPAGEDEPDVQESTAATEPGELLPAVGAQAILQKLIQRPELINARVRLMRFDPELERWRIRLM